MKIKGFTLVELVVVIIVLGILAVVAAPKFLSLDEDAKKARMESNAAAVKSAIEMVRHKAAIGPMKNINDDNLASEGYKLITINGVNLPVHSSNFYPFFNFFPRDQIESNEINAVLNLDNNFEHLWWEGGFYLYPKNISDEQAMYCYIWYDIDSKKIKMEYKGC